MSFQLDTRSKGRLNAGKRAHPSSAAGAGSAAAALQAAAANSVILNLVDAGAGNPDSFLSNVEQVKEQLVVANRLLQALASLLKSNDITQVQSKMSLSVSQSDQVSLDL